MPIPRDYGLIQNNPFSRTGTRTRTNTSTEDVGHKTGSSITRNQGRRDFDYRRGLPTKPPRPGLPPGSGDLPGGTGESGGISDRTKKPMDERDVGGGVGGEHGDLLSQLWDIVNQGGIGMSDADREKRFNLMTQRLDPQYQSMIDSEQAEMARRGLYRSGMALSAANKTKKQQSEHYGQLVNEMELENLARQQSSLMQAMQLLMTARNADQSLGFQEKTRDLEIALQRELMRNKTKAQNQMGYMQLFSSLLTNPMIQTSGGGNTSPLGWLLNLIF